MKDQPELRHYSKQNHGRTDNRAAWAAKSAETSILANSVCVYIVLPQLIITRITKLNSNGSYDFEQGRCK
jgi:hypothetical protein